MVENRTLETFSPFLIKDCNIVTIHPCRCWTFVVVACIKQLIICCVTGALNVLSLSVGLALWRKKRNFVPPTTVILSAAVSVKDG